MPDTRNAATAAALAVTQGCPAQTDHDREVPEVDEDAAGRLRIHELEEFLRARERTGPKPAQAEQEEKGYTLYNFLQDKFSRVSANSAKEFCEAIKVTSRTKVSDIDHPLAEKLFKELQEGGYIALQPDAIELLQPLPRRW